MGQMSHCSELQFDAILKTYLKTAGKAGQHVLIKLEDGKTQLSRLA